MVQDAIGGVRDTARLWTRWSSLPGAELIVMFLIAHASVELSSRVLGIGNPIIASVFSIVWLGPVAARLSDLRRGHYLRWNICATRRFETAAMLIGGATPWAILQALHDTHPSWIAPQSVDLPLWVRICGAALGIYVIAAENRRAKTNQDASPRAGPLPSATVKSQARIVAMLMMSGSVFIGLVAMGCVIAAFVEFVAERSAAAVPVLGDQPIS